MDYASEVGEIAHQWMETYLPHAAAEQYYHFMLNHGLDGSVAPLLETFGVTKLDDFPFVQDQELRALGLSVVTIRRIRAVSGPEAPDAHIGVNGTQMAAHHTMGGPPPVPRLDPTGAQPPRASSGQEEAMRTAHDAQTELQEDHIQIVWRAMAQARPLLRRAVCHVTSMAERCQAWRQYNIFIGTLRVIDDDALAARPQSFDDSRAVQRALDVLTCVTRAKGAIQRESTLWEPAQVAEHKARDLLAWHVTLLCHFSDRDRYVQILRELFGEAARNGISRILHSHTCVVAPKFPYAFNSIARTRGCKGGVRARRTRDDHNSDAAPHPEDAYLHPQNAHDLDRHRPGGDWRDLRHTHAQELVPAATWAGAHTTPPPGLSREQHQGFRQGRAAGPTRAATSDGSADSEGAIYV